MTRLIPGQRQGENEMEMGWWRVKTSRMETLVLADSEVMARRKAREFWARLGGDITDEMIVAAEPEPDSE